MPCNVMNDKLWPYDTFQSGKVNKKTNKKKTHMHSCAWRVLFRSTAFKISMWRIVLHRWSNFDRWTSRNSDSKFRKLAELHVCAFQNKSFCWVFFQFCQLVCKKKLPLWIEENKLDDSAATKLKSDKDISFSNSSRKKKQHEHRKWN